MNNASLNI